MCFLLILIVAGSGTPGMSQTVDQTGRPIGGPLPIVPLKQPRPAQGPDAGQQWQTGRPPEEGAPVASFIDALQANDAAIEVIIHQGRLLTLKQDIAGEEGMAVIAVADPTIIDFQVLPNPRMLRITGKRVGVTDMSVMMADGQAVSFEVRVVYELQLLRAQLRQMFPDAYLKLGQLRRHLIVEGQARSPAQVSQIIQTIEAYLATAYEDGVYIPLEVPQAAADPMGADQGAGSAQPGVAPGKFQSKVEAKVINLIRVPGVHQVMLQVKIAELDRNGLREIGADILGIDPGTGNIFGTSIAGATVDALSVLGLGGLTHETKTANGSNGTAFGIFPSGDFEILLRALRQNSVLTVLAEPNLMALNGQQAEFLAGGEFPVPVPQSGGGAAGNITIEWKKFGVQLNFIPYVMEDESIRLQVATDVSSIDQSLGVTVLGTSVPGVNTRNVRTTVELREGQTLAIAGLLQVTTDGSTSRIPGLGDLPVIGTLFSNTSHKREERELLVLVTPFLVRPMNPDQVPPLPGEEVQDPNDLEFYLLNRIEGRTGRGHRSTTHWDDPLGLVRLLRLEQSHVCGPVGFSQ